MIEYSIIDERFSKAMVEFILTQDNLEATRDFDGKVVITNSDHTYRIGYISSKVSIYGNIPSKIWNILHRFCIPIPVPPPTKMVRIDSKHSVEGTHHHIPVLLEDETEYLREVLLRNKPHESDRFRHDSTKIKLQEIAEAWEE
jgi:hypothetical protein